MRARYSCAASSRGHRRSIHAGAHQRACANAGAHQRAKPNYVPYRAANCGARSDLGAN